MTFFGEFLLKVNKFPNFPLFRTILIDFNDEI